MPQRAQLPIQKGDILRHPNVAPHKSSKSLTAQGNDPPKNKPVELLLAEALGQLIGRHLAKQIAAQSGTHALEGRSDSESPPQQHTSVKS